MEDKQIADYFVVAGLTDNSMPLEDVSFDGNQMKSTYEQPPITDITVIIPSLGEAIPKGFTCIEYTPTGLTADLNYGSIRSPEVFLCYRRGRDRPPLFDIGVLYQGKEQLMSDAEVVLSTPYGRPANVNNSLSQHTYVTYRRAPDTAPCNDLVVSDICVVITSKGETPPHAYCMIKKNLNKSMLGSDVYLCYKKSMNKPRHIAYRPGIQFRYPEEDIANNPMPDSVPLFCLPMGATLEWWPINASTPKPVFSTFVLTVSDAAEKVYGSAVTFYERYPEEKMSKEQRAWLDMEDPDEATDKDYTINTIKSICILSHWPFFDTFEKFLRFLHKMAHSGPHLVPLERYITHFIYEVPFPSPQRPRILIQLSANDRIALAQPEDLPLPRRGASFKTMLLNLGPDGCLLLLLLTLTEQKILIHSLRPDVLTATAEALATCIFPFKWQCPYIPLCPLGLSDVLNAPLPYLIGVDSRFFDMYDPPAEVSCVDLDTNTISVSEEKKNILSVKLMPKRASRTLRATLQHLYEKIYATFWSERGKRPDDHDISLDRDFKIKKKELLIELEIQEAFLKFMASILGGYRSFLLPITKAPTVGATDPNSLFDMQGFLRSRDKSYVKFYSLMLKTQMFVRFIEERSFVSDMDSSLAFFDECSDKTDLDDYNVRLLELDDSHHSERTVFVTPPEPVGLPTGVTYSYEQFGTLNPALMKRPTDESLLDPSISGSGLLKPRSNSGVTSGSTGPIPNSPLARRTKHEIKNSQKVAKKHAETPMLWAKCLLNTCFSIWFIHLPSHVLISSSKLAALRSAYAVLVAMQKLRALPADEVCYRVMMQLCGVHSQPVLAVKVLFEMKRHGVQPNAITYGFYNKAVLEAHWSSDMANHSRLLWHKLRNVITAGALFRRAGRAAAQKRLSQYSSTDEADMASGSDGDGLSRTSVDSSQEGHLPAASGAPIVYRNSTVTSSQSDVGYSSMKEDAKSSSQKDLPVAVKGAEDGNATVKVAGGKMVKSLATAAASTSASSAPVRLELDFSESDEFRSRVGSIVRKSAHNAAPDQSVDSAAGVLMTSLGNGAVGILSPVEATELKAALDSAGQIKGATLPRITTPVGTASTPETNNSSTKTNHHSASTASLFRSASLRLGEMLASPLESHLSPAKAVLADRLQWARSSIRKKLDMNTQEQIAALSPTKVEEMNSSKLVDVSSSDPAPEVAVNGHHPAGEDEADFTNKTVVEELAEAKAAAEETRPLRSPERTTITHGDPLGALDLAAESLPPTPARQERPPEPPLISPKRLVLPDPRARLFVDDAKSSKASSTSESSEENSSDGDDDSSSGSGSSEETDSDEEESDRDDVPSASKLSFSRYTGARWSLRKPEFKGVNLGAQVLGTALNSLSPQNLNARKAELLVGLSNLKSAASSVAKKFDEIKGAIGVAGVSVTPSKMSGSGLLAESERGGSSATLLSVEGPTDGSLETWSSWTAQWLRRASSADLAAQQFGNQTATGSGTPSEWSTTDGQTNSNFKGAPSWTEISAQLDRLCASLRSPGGGGKRRRYSKQLPIAVEVTMTSCTKCHNCQSLLYDEEIMAGWTPEDSNLNTRCPHCKKLLVPFLTVHLRDYRSHPPSALQQLCTTVNAASTLTPGVSQESVLSLSHSRNNSDGERIKSDETADRPSITRNASQQPSPLISPAIFDPVTVPYLSPLVLRRELENILEQEGDVCLTKPKFVDQHSILYWNMLWYFERVGLISHIASLILGASVGLNETGAGGANGEGLHDRIDLGWLNADESSVVVKTKWDNPRLHDDVGAPCYALWQQTDEQLSPLISALVTEHQPFPRSLLQQLLSGIQYNDMLRPLKLLASELGKRRTRTGSVSRHHGIYRELLFLSFVAIGRENIDQIAFDREYRLAYDRLDAQSIANLGKVDNPPSIASVFCRHFFRQLDL